MYIYIYVCVHMYMHMYTYIYIYTHMHTVCICMYVYLYIYTRICAIVKVGFYIPISVVGHSSRIHNGGMTMTDGRWPVQNHGCPK